MKILFDVGHPSFVHLFKNCARHFFEQGDEILFAARDKDITYELLQNYKLPFHKLGKVAHTVPGKIFGLIKFDVRLYSLTKAYKPDIILSGASPYAAHVAHLRKIPHILFDDTQNREQLFLYKYCSQLNLTPSSFNYDLGRKHFTYPGFHELAYLHPAWFQRDDKIKNASDGLVICRFISHNASHDTFLKGLRSQDKILLVNELRSLGKVIISSEVELPEELLQYRYNGPKVDLHALLAEANLFVGESATMASEAAMLGVPSVFFDPVGRCYTNELEDKYGLVYTFGTSTDQVKGGLEKAKVLYRMDPKQLYASRKLLLSENVDLTSLMIWMVENHMKLSTMDQLAINHKCKEFIHA